jgi:Glycosyltransferase sugar-binding region containing DXD motif
MIPRVAHFVFGLQEQTEPLHFLHYASLESCRRTLQPEAIHFHHKHLPWGPWWERIRPHLTLAEVDLAPEVLAADYSQGHVPDRYRYAHHSDFIRLDALLAHGGVYADIDTIFVRPFRRDLFAAPFVIGREPAVRDERSGDPRPSLCNALLMSEPGAAFAQAWRERMAAELNGTWSNHSGFLSAELSRELPAAVRVEPEVTFFSFPATPAGLSRLLEHRHPIPGGALSVHLWAHLWWDRDRWDFSQVHAGRYIPSYVRRARTTLADLVRPCLPTPTGEGRRPQAGATTGIPAPRPQPAHTSTQTWRYLSLDEDSGYGVAASRCVAALEQTGFGVAWTPFVPGPAWGYVHEPAPGVDLGDEPVVIAHLVPEYLPMVRARRPDAFLVAHTVWDTNRIPDHWIDCLDAADLVVVPSRFSADAMAAVRPPVAIVPHVAPAAPPSGPGRAPALSEVPDDVVVFYTIAEWNQRKAPFLAVEAYLRAFTGRDRVLLIVKTSHWDHRASAANPRLASAAGPGTAAWSLARLLAAHPDPPAIRLITLALSEHGIVALHARGDCYVSLARGEGWGLGAFDAAAHGNPVITTGFGGQLDYLGDSPQLVRFDLVPVDDPAGLPSYAPYQRWAEPDVDHATSLLRRFASDPRRASALAQSLGARIRRQYGPRAIATSLRAAVAQHAVVGSEHADQPAPTTSSRRS